MLSNKDESDSIFLRIFKTQFKSKEIFIFKNFHLPS